MQGQANTVLEKGDTFIQTWSLSPISLRERSTCLCSSLVLLTLPTLSSSSFNRLHKDAQPFFRFFFFLASEHSS